MATIRFERVLRDCPFNTTHARDPKTRLIYDIRVLVDGEYRAIYHPCSHSRGWELCDAGHQPIHWDDQPYRAHLGLLVDRKADLEPTILKLLDLGRLPTVAHIVAAQAAKRQAREQRIAERRLHAHISAVQGNGVALYEALEALVAAHVGTHNAPMRKACLLLDRVKAEADQAAADVDADAVR